MEDLVVSMTEIFEVESVQQDDVLREYDLWDSLSVISLIASLDELYGFTIDATDLTDVVTAADLFALVEQRRVK